MPSRKLKQPSWTLEKEDVELEQEAQALPGEAAERTTFRHLFEPRDVHAINAALAAGRPLLVRGEPGVGKSQLARAAAKGLDRWYVSKVIDARTEAQDLLWDFDAVRRLANAQALRAEMLVEGETVRQHLDELNYVRPGPLWWGFDWNGALKQAARAGTSPPAGTLTEPADRGAVVLLDEIDKADSSVPNGLLECLGNRRFAGPAGTEVRCGAVPPLVVVTTNEERSLPDAFLRRCLVLQLSLPTGSDLTDWLHKRGRAHFDEEEIAEEVLQRAAEMLVEDRAAAQRRGLSPPGGAEYLDLLRALFHLGRDTAHRIELLDEIRDFTLRKHPEDHPA